MPEQNERQQALEVHKALVFALEGRPCPSCGRFGLTAHTRIDTTDVVQEINCVCGKYWGFRHALVEMRYQLRTPAQAVLEMLAYLRIYLRIV